MCRKDEFGRLNICRFRNCLNYYNKDTSIWGGCPSRVGKASLKCFDCLICVYSNNVVIHVFFDFWKFSIILFNFLINCLDSSFSLYSQYSCKILVYHFELPLNKTETRDWNSKVLLCWKKKYLYKIQVLSYIEVAFYLQMIIW